jgi:threonine dehydrogenase-like Zn-dependent dehydrogenase
VGLNAVESAYFLGASKVYAIDKIPERLKVAESLGAIPIIGDDAAAQIIEATKGIGVDSFIEAVGHNDTIRMGFDLVRSGGVISVVGAAQSNDFSFPMGFAFWRNLRFHIGLCQVRLFWDELIPLVQAGRLKPERVVTHHMGLSEGEEAYRLFDARKAGVIKIILDPEK